MQNTQPHIFEFAGFRLDTAKQLLLRNDGDPISLTPKVFQTLLYLVRHGGRVIDKDELMSAIWPDTVVEENNLNQNISTLRRVLGDNKDQQRIIATVSGRGYRFIPEVTARTHEEVKLERTSEVAGRPNVREPEDTRTSSARESNQPSAKRLLWLPLLVCILLIGLVAAFYFKRPAAKTGPVATAKTIAVLPFKPLVAENRDESLEMGMAETLIARLSHSREVVVRPLSSVRRYGGLDQDPLKAGRELAVESVLDGHIQTWGDRIRVTVRLMSVGDGSQLWAGQFDEKFTDIFTVQDVIAEKVAGALALTLTGEEQKHLTKHYTEDAEAYQMYVYGRFYRNKRTEEGSRMAIQYFERAIARDPNYALAHAGLSEGYIGLAVFGATSPKEIFPRARAAAIEALRLDDRIAESHVAMAHVKAQSERDWSGADIDYQRATELNPNYADAYRLHAILLMESGRREEAFQKINRALELEPTSVLFNATLGFLYHWARQYDEAVEQLQKTIKMDSAHWLSHYWLAQVYTKKGMHSEALTAAQKARELSGDIGSLWVLGYVYAAAGRRTEAEQQINQLLKLSKQRYVPPYDIAAIYAALGDKDQAFAWLEKADEDQSRGMDFLNVNPVFETLHADPRFGALTKRLGRQALTVRRAPGLSEA